MWRINRHLNYFKWEIAHADVHRNHTNHKKHFMSHMIFNRPPQDSQIHYSHCSAGRKQSECARWRHCDRLELDSVHEAWWDAGCWARSHWRHWIISGNSATGSCGGNLSERLNRLQRSIGKSCMQLWMRRQSSEIKAPGITGFLGSFHRAFDSNPGSFHSSPCQCGLCGDENEQGKPFHLFCPLYWMKKEDVLLWSCFLF